tara:strand:- start:392 stop:925 length:534 start_codon:yes stop_codon:yes gene_type:complete
MNLRWYYLIERPVYQKRVGCAPIAVTSQQQFMPNTSIADNALEIKAPASNLETTETPIRETVITGGQSVKDWAETSGFIELAHDYDKSNPNKVVDLGARVRENVNGKLFVTFTNKQNKAENIYFSQNEAALHVKGELISKGFFDDMQMLEVTYVDNGEMRLKLSKTSPRRTAVADLF